MSRLKRESNPPTGQFASPIPQYKDTATSEWEEIKGESGSSYVKDRDALNKLTAIEDKINTLAKMELYGATVDQRPAINTVPVGAAYMAVNSGNIWQSNGFEWVVIV